MELKLSEMKVGEKGKIIGYGKGAKVFRQDFCNGAHYRV